MGSCLVCGGVSTIAPDYTSGTYCDRHFWELIERRVRKDLRIHQQLDVKRSYSFNDDGSPLAALTRRLLENIFDGRLAFVDDARSGFDVIMPTCLEQDVSERFQKFLEGDRTPIEGIRPLRTVSIVDVNALVPGDDLSVQEYLHPLLLSLESEQKGMRFAFSKSLREME